MGSLALASVRLARLEAAAAGERCGSINGRFSTVVYTRASVFSLFCFHTAHSEDSSAPASVNAARGGAFEYWPGARIIPIPTIIQETLWTAAQCEEPYPDAPERYVRRGLHFGADGVCGPATRPDSTTNAARPTTSMTGLPIMQHDDALWLDRVTFGLDSAAVADLRRLGRERFLEQQLDARDSALPARSQHRSTHSK